MNPGLSVWQARLTMETTQVSAAQYNPTAHTSRPQPWPQPGTTPLATQTTLGQAQRPLQGKPAIWSPPPPPPRHLRKLPTANQIQDTRLSPRPRKIHSKTPRGEEMPERGGHVGFCSYDYWGAYLINRI